jgi:hypothetical protein
LIPVGLVVTVPVPVPVLVIVRVLGGIKVNVAVQARATDIVTLPSLQSASPLQPENTEPGAGVAVRVTMDAAAKSAEHVTPQVMPAGVVVTEPAPVPAFVIVNV